MVSCYYVHQSVGKVSGFMKDDLDSLPIKRHNDETIRSYLFLQLRNLKCKTFIYQFLVDELTKYQKEVCSLCRVIAPKKLGILEHSTQKPI